MTTKLIKRRNTLVMKFTTKLNSNQMRLDSEAIVGTEATEEVASEITINIDLSQMGKGISEEIVAIEVTEADNEEATMERLKTRESMLKVNSSGGVMTEVEATKGATEEEETFKENKILFSGIVTAEVVSGPKETVMTSKLLALNVPIAAIKIASLTRVVANTMARCVITTGQAFAEGVIGVVNKSKINLINIRCPQI